MELSETLQSHRGGLLHLKTKLYWYDGRGCDKDPGRFCLLLDVITIADCRDVPGVAFTAGVARTTGLETTAVLLLLIDGRPQRVWVAEQDIEVISEH